MYKYLSIILGVLILVCASFYAYERYSHAKTRKNLNNQIAQLSDTLKETETAYSKLAIETNEIVLQNEELQKIIDDRDEEIISLSEIVLKWKNKYFEIKDAQQDIVDHDGNPVDLDEICQECFSNNRFKVSFDQTKDYLRIYGNTFTNPPEAYINLEWVKDIVFNLILAKNDDIYRIYLDTNNSDIVPIDIKLKIDSSVYDTKWYERIGIFGNISVGDGLMTSVGSNIFIFDDFLFGPILSTTYDGNNIKKYYGLNIGWFPFK